MGGVLVRDEPRYGRIMSLRTPLGKALGLGSAKDGAGHWWMQRVSAIALIVLGAWLVIVLPGIGGLDYQHASAWVARPINSVLLTLLLIAMLYHSKLGIQVVIEDYVNAHALKVFALLLSVFVHILLMVLGVFSVLRISGGGLA